jgi:digeranylgeranylglycerophospholipid reductase
MSDVFERLLQVRLSLCRKFRNLEDFDFLVAGGSVAGLAFASEAAKKGARVLVAEEHDEIGEPEKCDGLVSLRGFRRFGYSPESGVIQDSISSAVVHSPRGKQLAVSATHLEVVVVDRSEFDKQVARAAEANGAAIRTGARVGSVSVREGRVEAKVGDESVSSKYLVDATGPASSPRGGILPAAKYELEGDWVKEHVVEVFMDAEKYPGFFAWVIPYGERRAKVGAAGHGINPFKALDGFLEGRRSEILRRVSAPIYVGGPAEKFVEGRTIRVGESAGQVKPTTAGGILTSVAGSVIAAKWACESLERNDVELLSNYQPEWEGAFLPEMRTMLRLRSVLEKLSNSDLESVVGTMTSARLARKLSNTDFDFHASALLGVLGIPGLLRVAKVVASAEIRSLLIES